MKDDCLELQILLKRMVRIMPFYKLICKDCGEAFEERASIESRTGKKIACPVCGSHELQTDYAAGSANVHVAQNQNACPHGAGCGCCCHGGPGGQGK